MTAIVTPFGSFEFLRMPFGLKNAAQTFQRLMDTVCRGSSSFFVYLDDILIFSHCSEQQHLQHLKQLFQRLKDYGPVISLEKCRFGVREIEFLGHRVNKDGLLPLPMKIEAIKSYPKPTIQ